MSSHIRVEWTLVSKDPLSVTRPCGRCGQLRQFASTNKFRLNANGSRLDAWLIYACQSCGHRWNREVFKRQAIGSVPPGLMSALQTNDTHLAESLAAELAGEPRHSALPHDFELLVRVVPRDGDSAWQGTVLRILNPGKVPVRLDRVLSTGLRIPRREIKGLINDGFLAAPDAFQKKFRRPVPLCLDLPVNTRNPRFLDALTAGNNAWRE